MSRRSKTKKLSRRQVVSVARAITTSTEQAGASGGLRGRLLAATALAGVVVGMPLTSQTAFAACHFTGDDTVSDFYTCGPATDTIIDRDAITDNKVFTFTNQAVTTGGVHLGGFAPTLSTGDITFNQVSSAGIVQYPVPDIANTGTGSGAGAAALSIHTTGNITVFTSGANPTLGAGTGWPTQNTATLRSTSDDGMDLESKGNSTIRVINHDSIVAFENGINAEFQSASGTHPTIDITNFGNIGFDGATGLITPVGNVGIFAGIDTSGSSSGTIHIVNAVGGNIWTDGKDGAADGIRAEFDCAGGAACGNISITNAGNIIAKSNTGSNASHNAIYAAIDGNGNITILNTGNLTSTGTGGNQASGIFAKMDGNGTVAVTNTGNIIANDPNAQSDGVHVEAGNGGNIFVIVTNSGNITAFENGVFVDIDGNANSFALVTNSGNITGGENGIAMEGTGLATLNMINTGYVKGDAAVYMEQFSGGTINALNAAPGHLDAIAVVTTYSDSSTAGVGMWLRAHQGGSVNAANTGTIGNPNLVGLGPVSSNGIFARVADAGDINIGNGCFPCGLTPTVVDTAAIFANANAIRAVIDDSDGTGHINIANYGGQNLGGPFGGDPFTAASSTRGLFGGVNGGIPNSGGSGELIGSAVSVTNEGNGTIHILNAGTMRGVGSLTAPDDETAVIQIDSPSPTFIWNTSTGVIQPNGNLTPARLAIMATGNGDVEIDNDGILIGRVSLSMGNNTFNNGGGLWIFSGESSFNGDGNTSNTINNLPGGVIRTIGYSVLDFGDATNVINNSGAFEVRNNPLLGVDGRLDVDGVHVFNNAGGLIDMTHDNGPSGTQTTTNVFAIGGDDTAGEEGDFHATGDSRLAVNAFLGAPGSTADRLFIAGNVTGTGTAIIVRDTNPGPGAYNPVGIAVVGVGGTSTESDFFLSPFLDHADTINGVTVLDKGLFFYFLALDPKRTSTGCDDTFDVDGNTNEVDHCHSLYSLPSRAALQLPIAITAAEDIWHETALMWEDRQTELRNRYRRGALVVSSAGADMPLKAPKKAIGAPPPPPPYMASVWTKVIGSWTNQKAGESETLQGHTFTFDLGYKQQTLGLIGGVDWGKEGVANPYDAFVLGVMGGFIESHVNFNHGGSSFKYTGGTVGGSASYMNNGFFADVLVKADFLRLSWNVPLLAGFGGLPAVDATTVGVLGNLGYRFDFGPMFFEPIGTLAFSSTRIDNIVSVPLAATIQFANADSFRGAIGARVGTQVSGWQNHRVDASITGRVWDEFNNNNPKVTLVNLGPTVTLEDSFLRKGTFGEVKGGFDVISMGAGWGGFVNAGVKFNDKFTTVTAKGGLTYSW